VSNPGDDDGVMGSSVMLVDFGGVAAAADQENRMNTMTIVGTLDFMAPEQYRGRTSPLSDVGIGLDRLLPARPVSLTPRLARSPGVQCGSDNTVRLDATSSLSV